MSKVSEADTGMCSTWLNADAKLAYVNASGSAHSGILVSKRVDQVFAEWRYTNLMPAPKFKTPRNNAENSPTVEFFDCDYEQERHAIVMLTDCDLFGALKVTTKYDRAVKPAIQLIAQPNADLD